MVQCVFKPAFDGKFYSSVTSLIGYLQRQQNLNTEMQSTCPKVADTKWISMHSTTKWLVQHCLCVTEYLNDKTPLCTPNTLWWFFFMQFMDLLLNPNCIHFLTRINYHCIRATALHEWVDQDLLPNDWNVGPINQ